LQDNDIGGGDHKLEELRGRWLCERQWGTVSCDFRTMCLRADLGLRCSVRSTRIADALRRAVSNPSSLCAKVIPCENFFRWEHLRWMVNRDGGSDGTVSIRWWFRVRWAHHWWSLCGVAGHVSNNWICCCPLWIPPRDLTFLWTYRFKIFPFAVTTKILGMHSIWSQTCPDKRYSMVSSR
jgi:hypothetical protein